MKKGTANISLLNAITSGIWCINNDYAMSLMPIAFEVLQGRYDFGSGKSEKEPKQEDTTPRVEVMKIRGVISRDGWCSYGTESLANQLLEMAKKPYIYSIILDIHSGGGEAQAPRYLTEAINRVREQKKVVAYINNMACSAAYNIASSCEEIILSNAMAQVGSIGTFFSMTSYAKYYEKQGIDIFEVYATKSTEKNKPIRELLKGNPDAMVEQVDMYNEDFLATVQKYRPNIREEALNGAVYFGQKAIDMGLADRIDTLYNIVSAEMRQNTPIRIIHF